MFTQLFERYHGGLLGFAIGMLGNREDAEEIITEAFLKLSESDGKFENELAVGGWLRVTVKNKCINLLKTRQLYQNRLNEFARTMEVTENEFFHEELMTELMQEVYAAIETLPLKSREVFRLRYVEGLDNEDIARRLQIKNQSVRNHLTVALNQLRVKFMNRPDLLLFLLLLLPAHQKVGSV